MKRQNIFSLFILAVCAALNLSAQTQLIQPRIKMSTGTDENAVRLSNLAVEVEVTGNIATTTYDMIFTNSSNRILEGEFEFPLDNGQTVSRYALDINGKLREGVVVEKEKGRQVFETIVRKNIDPGLVEMTSGNNFKTRVYPIPAKGSRHVVIAFEQELKTIDGNRTYILQPLTDGTIDTFEFSMKVLNSSFKHANESSSFETLSIEDWNNSYNAHFKKENYTQTKPLSFSLPSAKNDDTFVQTLGTDTYFYYYTPMEPKAREKKLPSKIAILYDVSSSAEKRDKSREFALLEKYISACKAKTISVTTFSNTVHETKSFNSAAAVKEYLEKQQYDGATNFSAIDFDALAKKADEILVFSDGMNTWGDSISLSEGSKAFEAAVPVTAVNSCASANHSMLTMLATKNDGVYIDLCSKTNEEAIDMLTKETYRLLNVEYDSAKFSSVYPEKGAAVNGTFSMAGILKKKSGTIKLAFGYGKNVTDRIDVEISAVKGIEAENVQRMWAQKKIENLSVFYDDNKTEITELAKKFNIVTQETSLIVLDNVSDYVRYGITPPAELKDEYDRLVRSNSKPVSNDGIPASVYRTFEAFKKWWNTSPKEFKEKKKPRKAKGDMPLMRNDSAPDTMFLETEPTAEGVSERRLSTQAATAPMAANAQVYSDMAEESMMLMEDASADARKAADGQARNTTDSSKIELQSWSPDNDYLKKLKKTSLERMYSVYLELKAEYKSSPAFFMEVSDYFFDEGLKDEAYRILSNLAEMEIENSDILRALGNKLVERKDYANAIWVYKKLTKIRSEIPQFYRDLAMAYHYNGENQNAVDTLWSMSSKAWNSRFEEIQQIALNDMNSIIALSGKKSKLDTSSIDKKLMENFPVDVRVVLTWNTDNCDIDLWVTDPDGEKCYYQNKVTANGGHLSRDFTQGYGPEEFCIKEAPEGTYKIEANYYGTSSQKMLQPVIVQAEVFTNFGRENQKREVLTLQLDSVKGVFTIGTITFKK
ncbi:MAG: DUF2135 domain-containing protein [Spirochaetaceae bacterium]|nr:DUF2135 domain-containing protein [Spirochaetaceae bacterium]